MARITGLGDATLFGFYPGYSTAFVQQIDKASGSALGPKLSIPGGLGFNALSWAFAFWGGRFYLFVSTTDGLNTNSTVRLMDRVTGQYFIVLQNLPRLFSSAGVSTCAPVTLN